MTVRGELARRRIGGRWAVSWQGYLFLYAVSLPLSIAVVPALASPGQWLAGVLVATLAYGVAGLVLALAAMSVLRHRRTRPAPVALVAAVGGCAWLARSAVFVGYLEAAGLPAETSSGSRLVVGFLLGAVLVPAVAWLLATLDDARLERRRLLDELAVQEAAAEESETYLGILRDDLWARVAAELRASTDQDPRGQDGSHEDLAAELDRLAVTVRSASKRLAPDSDGSGPQGRLRVADILALVERRPFTLWPIPFYLVVAFLYVVRLLPASTTGAAVALAGAWVAIAALAANRMGVQAVGPAARRYAFAVVAVALNGAVVTGALLAAGVDTWAAVRAGLVIGLPFTVVMVAGGVARAVNVAEGEVLADIRSDITAAEVQREVLATEERRVRRDIATHLHGTVAANVVAATMRLRSAVSSGDVEAAQQAYAEARRNLDVDRRSATLIRRSDLRGLLGDLAASWSGIATVSVTVEGIVPDSPSLLRDVVDVVTEGISNAVRHGSADHVIIRVEVKENHVHVTVRDDGIGTESTPSGLGSALFDRVSAGRWSLTADGGAGSILAVRLAAEVPSD